MLEQIHIIQCSGGIIFGERCLTSVFVGFVIGHLHSAHSFYLNCTDTNHKFSGKVSAVYTSALPFPRKKKTQESPVAVIISKSLSDGDNGPENKSHISIT